MGKNWIKVGLSSCGIAAGADKVFEVLKREIEKKGLDVEVKRCGCRGNCSVEPMVEVSTEGLPVTTYVKVDESVAVDIVEKHIRRKLIVDDHLFSLK